MAPPASSRALARLAFTFLLAALNITATAATFPLPIPTRPTSFPLSRPTQMGEVVAWGSNTFGQISVPPNLTNVVAIAAGLNHNLALRSDGTVTAWGDNQYGQCNVPPGLTDVVAVAGGNGQSLALKTNGRVVAWGSASQPPAFLTDAISIAADPNDSFAVRIDGTPVRWGPSSGGFPYNRWTNLVAIVYAGGNPVGIRPDGLAVGGGVLYQVTDVAAVPQNFYAGIVFLRRDGSIYNGFGGVAPLGLKVVDLAVTSRAYVSAGITGDGSVIVWPGWYSLPISDGYNPDPVLAVLTNPPPRLRGVISIKGGEAHFLALKLPTPPIPTTAVASAQIANGFIIGLNIIDGGEGYDVPPKVTITGGGGSGATATAQISKGIVTGFTMTSAGIGYTSQPTITIDSPPFLPKLSIAPSRVNVVLQVVPGKRYQLESSDDLPNFSPVGSPFTATSNTLTNEFTLSDTGQFFRIQEVP